MCNRLDRGALRPPCDVHEGALPLAELEPGSDPRLVPAAGTPGWELREAAPVVVQWFLPGREPDAEAG